MQTSSICRFRRRERRRDVVCRSPGAHKVCADDAISLSKSSILFNCDHLNEISLRADAFFPGRECSSALAQPEAKLINSNFPDVQEMRKSEKRKRCTFYFNFNMFLYFFFKTNHVQSGKKGRGFYIDRIFCLHIR